MNDTKSAWDQFKSENNLLVAHVQGLDQVKRKQGDMTSVHGTSIVG